MSKVTDYLTNPDFLIKKVHYGGHWSDNPDWLLLAQVDQDVTTPLECPDEVFDCVAHEHTFEHLPFAGAILFLKESLRVLKPGGTLRITLPCLETILNANLDCPKGEKYVYTSLVPHFSQEDYQLKMLGLDGLEADPMLFLLNSMSNKHEHTFLWSLKLLKPILEKVGFSKVTICSPGVGSNPDFCIERRARGIYLGRDWKENMTHEVYDVESGVIEAIK